MRPAVLTCLVIAACLPPGPARAQSLDVFAVRNVQQDFHDINPSQARTRALTEGPRAALRTLLQRMTAESDWPRLPQPAEAALEDLVLDVGIDQEKSSATHYFATLSVRFKAEPVRRLLREQSIAYAEWRGPPVMVVPIVETEAGPVWDGAPNAWRDLWKSSLGDGVVAIKVPPQGDVGTTAPLAAIAGGSPDGLAMLVQHTNSPDVAVIVATPQKAVDNTLALTVTVAATGPVAGVLSGPRSYTGEAGESLDSLMRRAVLEIVAQLNDGWKRDNLLQYGVTSDLVVEVSYANFAEWLAIREKLARATPVRSYDIAALGRTEAALVLHYVGDQARMEAAFMQNGLVLSWLDEHWTLRMTLSHAAVMPGDPRGDGR